MVGSMVTVEILQKKNEMRRKNLGENPKKIPEKRKERNATEILLEIFFLKFRRKTIVSMSSIKLLR